MAWKATSWLAIMVAVLTLGGCATRPGADRLVPVVAADRAWPVVTVFAATDRAPEPSAGGYEGRRGGLSYEVFRVGVAPGSALKGRTARSFATDFLTLGRSTAERDDFFTTVAHQAQAPDKRVLIFVHGYNYSYQEALFQTAQLASDGPGAVPIMFSWPSRAHLGAYAADKDAATAARDDLAALIATVAQSGDGRSVTVVGHSLGGWLVLEALRQLRHRGRGDVLRQLDVGLAAPDVDLDVFRTQVAAIGRMETPITVLVAADDRALALSRRVAGGRPRLGGVNVADARVQALARDYGLRIVDISALPAGDGFRHDRFVFLAATQSRRTNTSSRPGLRSTGAYVLDRAGTLLSAPFEHAARVLGGQR